MLANYQVMGSINAARNATIAIEKSEVLFGVLSDQEDLPNPAELLLGAFAACCLKNVQRFSEILGFEYDSARIEVTGQRQTKPTKIVSVSYIIHIRSTDEKLNTKLLHRNVQKFGTIYNTLKGYCEVSGELLIDE